MRSIVHVLLSALAVEMSRHSTIDRPCRSFGSTLFFHAGRENSTNLIQFFCGNTPNWFRIPLNSDHEMLELATTDQRKPQEMWL